MIDFTKVLTALKDGKHVRRANWEFFDSTVYADADGCFRYSCDDTVCRFNTEEREAVDWIIVG